MAKRRALARRVGSVLDSQLEMYYMEMSVGNYMGSGWKLIQDGNIIILPVKLIIIHYSSCI
jgi:hypothetical protein